MARRKVPTPKKPKAPPPVDPRQARHRAVLREIACGTFRHQFRLIAQPAPKASKPPHKRRQKGGRGEGAVSRHHQAQTAKNALATRFKSCQRRQVIGSPYVAHPGWPEPMTRELAHCRTAADYNAWSFTWAGWLSGEAQRQWRRERRSSPPPMPS